MKNNHNHKERKEKSIWSFVALPDYFSLASIASSLIAIELAFQHHYGIACLLLVLSVILDGMDGVVARFINRRGRFGAELDSIADVVAFGVAPAFFAFSLGLDRPLDVVLLLAFVMASALRLARFNVLKVRGHVFVGLPTTANGVIVPLLYFILKFNHANWFVTQTTFLVWFALSTILMISIVRVPKPHIG